MGIAGHPGAPRIVSVLASMAGFAGGVYLATKIKRSSQSAAHEGEQATGVVWPRLTTFALGILFGRMVPTGIFLRMSRLSC